MLLDSTYLLPVFGVEVKGVSDETLLRLRSLALGKLIVLHYSPVSFIEVVAKVAREAMRRGVRLDPSEVAANIRVVEESGYLKPIHPDAQAYALAYRMRLLGRRDMIDNILYATATVKGLILISMESHKALRGFIQRHRIEGARILAHTNS